MKDSNKLPSELKEDLIDVVRKGVNQANYSQPWAKLVTVETTILSFVFAFIVGIWLESFTWGLITLFVFPILYCLAWYSIFRPTMYLISALVWAAPFVILGAFASFFYVFIAPAIILSLIAHYFGFKYYDDLG